MVDHQRLNDHPRLVFGNNHKEKGTSVEVPFSEYKINILINILMPYYFGR